MQTTIKWSTSLRNLKRLIIISISQMGLKEEGSDLQGEGDIQATHCLPVHRQGYGRIATKIQPHKLQKTASSLARSSRERYGACSHLNKWNGVRFHPAVPSPDLLIGIL